MIIFIDFDYTLFDAGAFRQAMRQSVNAYQVTGEIFDECYATARVWNGGTYGSNYTFQAHAACISDRVMDIDQSLLVEHFEACITTEFLYEGYAALLTMLHDSPHRVVLLTAGNPSFQQKKIETLGLQQYVDECVYIPGDKVDYIDAHFSHEEQLLCINDDLVESRALRERRPDAHIVIKQNTYRNSREELEASGFPFFNSLTHIQEYVRTII